MELPAHGHEPVMLAEVLAHLNLAPGQTAVDCTVGRGGHSEAIAQKIKPGGHLLALDVDPENLKYARARVDAAAAGAAEGQGATCRYFHANFGELEDVVRSADVDGVDAVLADLGVSTNQIFDGKHGLSFSEDEKLDMRLDPRIRKTAADLVATLDEKELARILFEYAQERFSRQIARKIVSVRAVEPMKTTGQLARVIKSVVPPRYEHGSRIDPSTRTFQALRMAVNDELGVLEAFLDTLPEIMNPGGRVVVISFHSGEDRLVKHAFRGFENEGFAEVLTKKPLEPSETEIARNPRSRSAKLRACVFK